MSVTAPCIIAPRRARIVNDLLHARQIEQYALAQAAAADLQRPAQRLRGGVEREQPRGHQPHPLGVELEARRDVRGRTAGQDAAARARGSSRSSSSPTSRRSDAALPPTAIATSTGGGVDAGEHPRGVHAHRVAARRGAAGRRPGRRRPGTRSRTRTTPTTRRRRRPSRPRSRSSRRRRRPPRRALAAAVRASASRPGTPAAPPPPRRARTPRRRRASRIASQNSSRLAALPDHGGGDRPDACARPLARPARAARRRRSRSRRSAPPGSSPPGVNPRPRRVNARRCRTSCRRPVARLGDQHAGGVRPDVDAATEHSPASDVAMMEAMTSGVPAIEVRGLSKAYGAHQAACAGSTSRSRAARCSACWGPTAPARRPASRCSRATARAIPARSACSVTTPGTARAQLRARVGIVLQSCGTYPHLTVARDGRALGVAVPGAAPGRRGARAGGAGRMRRPPRPHAQRRPGAAAGLRARAGRRPGADLPRRADHRLRPRAPAAPPGTSSARCATSARPSC